MFAPLLSLRGVGKRFGRLDALIDVDADFQAGEVHAVLGENGAGKSTLMNAIFGLVPIDRGTVRLDGDVVRFAGPLEARRAGIGMVHQDFALVDALSVTENLALALSPAGAWRWRREDVKADAERLAREVGLDLGDLDRRVGELPVGTRQRIEIVKALAGRPRVLILDEPTAVLTPAEIEQLFGDLARLRERGTAILFITHKLAEVMAIADRITVMRRGRVVESGPRAAFTVERLAERMVGEMEAAPARAPLAGRAGTERLRVDRLSLRAKRGGCNLDGLSLSLGAGEVLGIAGVDGNGQSELFAALAGLEPPEGGALFLDGTRLERHSPAARIDAALVSIPPDRRRQGTIATMSVAENAILSRALLRQLARGPFLAPERGRDAAQRLIESHRVRVPSLDAPVSALSGGNLQRLIVARSLAVDPRVLVAFNPTRGLDLAAARAVHDAFREACARDMAVLLISTDLEEIQALCDRIAVLYRGRLSDPFAPPVSTERLGLLMGGGGSDPGKGA